MDNYDIGIIGSGISGLSLAQLCGKKGLRTLVIEKSGRTGGAFHSHRINTHCSNEFWIELGAHTIYNSYGSLIDLLDSSHLLDSLMKRARPPYRVLYKGRIESIFKHINVFEVLFHLHKIFSIKKTDLTMKQYYSQIFGIKNYNSCLGHFFNAVPSQRAEDFPAEMLFKKNPRRKDMPRIFSPVRGLQTITDTIASQENISVLAHTSVISINHKKNQVIIQTHDKQTFRCSYLAIATPVSEAVTLLSSFVPAIARKLKKISFNRCESMGVIINRQNIAMKPVSGIIPLDDDSFFSIVSRDTIPHQQYRGFTFHFKPNCLDYQQKITKITHQLKIPDQDLLEIAEKENIMPSFRLGHAQIIQTVDSLLQDQPLLLTGNYFSGMAIEDCVQRSIKEFSRIFKR